MNTRPLHTPAEPNQLPDELLWETFKQGDKAAFSEIYQTHVDALYRYGMNFIRDSFLVKENIQDLFVNLWSRRESLGETNNIRFYLLRSLRRKIATHYKSDQKWSSFMTDDLAPLSNEIIAQSLEQFQYSSESELDLAKKLMLALDKLPVRQKEALYYIYYENLSYEEVAALMNVNIKTIYNLSWRGIETLRRTLPKNSFFSLSPVAIIMAFELLDNCQKIQ